MGGIACQIPTKAIMAGLTLPVQPANASDPQYTSACIAFDSKLRQVLAQTDVVNGIEDANNGAAACEILGKSPWTAQEREALWSMVQSLWAEYSS